MRKFLFRGKRLDNGEWVHGLLSFASKTTSIIKRDADGIPVAVDSKTVGQWTGFRDTNSCDIYEDDILQVWVFDGAFMIAYVRWDESGEWRIRFSTFPEDNHLGTEHYSPVEGPLYLAVRSSLLQKVEVIGNNHDNPELLGVGD